MTLNDQTAKVLQHHVDSFLAQDHKEMLADYTDESILITPTKTMRGLQEIEEEFASGAGLFTPENLSQIRGLYQDIQGEVAYTAWTMGDVVLFGTDTFIIRNGKIQVQTVGMYMP